MSGDSIPMPLILAFSAAIIGSCTVGVTGFSDEARAASTLRDQGWEPIQHEGKAMLACGEGDIYRDKFIAKNPQGQQVEVVVCRGLLKGATVRTI